MVLRATAWGGQINRWNMTRLRGGQGPGALVGPVMKHPKLMMIIHVLLNTIQNEPIMGAQYNLYYLKM